MRFHKECVVAPASRQSKKVLIELTRVSLCRQRLHCCATCVCVHVRSQMSSDRAE